MRINKLVKPIVLILCVAVMVYALLTMGNNRAKLDYQEHLEDTAVTVDSEEITFQDLAFYILYEEGKIEEQARIYNPDYTKDYWNLHTNDTFIQLEAKEVVLGMAVHDHLFYQMAVAEGMDTLTDEEEQELEYRITDFWEDLLDIQWEKLPCSEETINEQIRLAAIAEKYQNYLAEELGPSQAAYKYDGYYYQQIMEQHQVKTNDKLWDRLVLGDITLSHGKLNYINGLTDEDKKKK
ncbi:hypothetical protein SAMN02910377_02552 [Pseudobutyrivibrio ruminis]|uniref:Uncharacterized protein n=2 Tax=Pseudobutyrivibrio ruminis TaxID=46206 RepID=A0A1H7M582_9FIRM|nr:MULTISPECIES: hypothetical protein [Pseudobutyrivibrio]SEL06406.1 hypothetical protein SAMN02910377_02552 [Pseudobutyrivibrio ruminis]SFO53217.1 hypothetical protein SAMN05216351_11431 [Pseudobutyrivibrio sp. JW11]SOC18246.1 hypothetical protein SAMN02910411_0567 [Pseudobutyrivibrio ruminis DSM 9787]